MGLWRCLMREGWGWCLDVVFEYIYILSDSIGFKRL